jgi:hypothetical protein
MSNWNEEQARHKAKQRGIVEQRPITQLNKKKPAKPKVWRVYWPVPWLKKPYCVARFATREQAEAYIDKQRRRVYVSPRDQSPNAWGLAAQRAEREAKDYWIEGP